MFDSTGTRNAVLTMLGGALWMAALPLRSVRPVLGIPAGYFRIAFVIPVLLGVGVLEIRARYGDQYGSVGRAGVVLTGLGLALLSVALLLLAVFYPVFVLGFFFAAIPGAVGVVALAFGSAFLAVALSRLGVIDITAAVLLGLGVPLAVPVAVLLRVLVGPTGLVPIDPIDVAFTFGAAPYGAGWLLVGHRLRETADVDREAGLVERATAVGPSPQVAIAAVAGAVYLLFGAGAFLPLGPLSGDWLATGSVALDRGHLLVGAVGLVVAVLRNVRVARTYNRVVGLLSVVVVGLGPLQLETVRGLGWVPRRAGAVNVVLHLPMGVVLGVVGFGLGDGADGSETIDGGTNDDRRDTEGGADDGRPDTEVGPNDGGADDGADAENGTASTLR